VTILSYVFRLFAFTLAYSVAGVIGMSLTTYTPGVTLFWPAAGVGLAGLFLGGIRYAPAILIGGALVLYHAEGRVGLGLLLLPWCSLFQSLLGTYLLRRFDFQPAMNRLRDSGVLILAAVLAVFPFAWISPFVRLNLELIRPELYSLCCSERFLGDFLGILIVAPAMFTWSMRRRYPFPVRWVEGIGIYLGFIGIAVAMGMLSINGGGKEEILKFCYFPGLIWSAVRLGPRGVSLHLVTVALFVCLGPLIQPVDWTVPAFHDYLMESVAFLTVASVSTLMVSALMIERAQSAARTDTAERKLRAILQAEADGIWEWDLQCDTFTCSDRLIEILRLPPHDGRSHLLRQWVHPEDAAQLEAAFQRAIEGRQEFAVQVCLRRGDESEGHYGISGQWVDLRDGQQLLVGAVQDRTLQMETENQRLLMERKVQETARLESLGVLAGGIAHDFNNLLTIILGNTHLAQTATSPDAMHYPCFQAIDQAATRAADLCREMLNYAGKGRFMPVPLDLNTLLAESAHILAISIVKEVRLVWQLASHPIPKIKGDESQLRQILLNLVKNAAEALPATGGTIMIRSGYLPVEAIDRTHRMHGVELAEKQYAYLELHDTGCGIVPEMLSRIFEPFFTTKFTGRGLGLAAVAGMVQTHRGSIQVQSHPQLGTAIRVYLPTIEQPSTRSIVSLKETKMEGAALLIDGDEEVRRLTARILTECGLNVDHYSTPAEAADVFRRTPEGYRLAILDRRTSMIQGGELLDELHRTQPEMPIIMTIGSIDGHAPFTRVLLLQKPYSAEALRRIVRDAMKRGSA